MSTTDILAVAVAGLAVVDLATFAAFIRLRRRHRDCRHALARVTRERDDARRPAPWPMRDRPFEVVK